MTDENEPDLFAAQPAPKIPCCRCGRLLAEDDRHDDEECAAQRAFREYGRATMASVRWD